MPPPKKPKNKSSWEELMSSVDDGESTGACGGPQSPIACKWGSSAAVSNGPDLEARECRVTPEDLSLKSSEFQRSGCRESSSQQQKFPAFPKEAPPGFNIGREHPRLRDVLLGISDGKVVLESSTQSRGNGRDTDSWPQNQTHPSCPRKVWTADTSPENLPQVTFSTHSGARVFSETVVSEAEKFSRTCDINSAQIKKDSCELDASIVSQLETVESHLGDVPPSRSRQPEVSRIAIRIFADSTTNPVAGFQNAGNFRVLVNNTSPTRRPGHYRLFPVSNTSLEEIPNQEKHYSDTDFQRVLLSPVIGSMNSDCDKNKIHRLSPGTRISNVNCPQESRNETIKLDLKSLLSQDVVSPPGEYACNYINRSGVNKPISTKAPEDKRPSEMQENERLAMPNADNSSSPELPSSSCAELVTEKSTDAKGVCRCQVCDDVASGFHYGAWSCEGCKAFFKRSIHGPVDYVCPSTNNCTIDKLRRKSCQACRLRKCHEAGMMAGTCRKEKGLQSVGKKRKSSDYDMNVSESETGSCDNVGSSRDVPNQKRHSQPLLQSSFSPPSQAIESTTQTNSFIESLLAVELTPRSAEFDRPAVDSRPSLLAGLARSTNSQLMDVITWSKSLPDFFRSSLELRTRLLVTSWSELLILGTVWQSLPHLNTWVYAPNLHLTRDQCRMALIEPLFTQIMNVVQRLRHLSITQVELVLLRLAILLNNNVDVIESDPALANLRRTLDEAWHQISTDGIKSRSRVGNLFLTLPDVRQCSLMLRDLVRNVQPRDGVAAFELLNEMLDMDSGSAEVHVSVAETTSMH